MHLFRFPDRLARVSLAVALVSFGTAYAQTLGMYLSAPGQQTTTLPGTTVESFNRGVGPIGGVGAWDVGTFIATTGQYANAGQYGGALGTGQYLAVQGGPISVALIGDRKYVGFWWSAGDATNVIRFYDTANNLLVQFTTATLVNLLSGGGTITALDGNQYPKADYFGNPNSTRRANGAEPYGYVNLVLSGTSINFGRIEIRGTNFELDNLAIADSVSVDPSWVNYGNQPITLPPGAVGASNDSTATPVNTPVGGNMNGNDTALAGATWSKTTDPANGTVVVNADGTYVYTPAPGFSGIDSFDYQVCNPAPNQTTCASATVRISVGLDAVDDAVSTTPNTPVSAGVPGNDLFPAGSGFTVSASPSRGNVVLDPTTGTYTYTPNPGFTGTDAFSYRLCLPAPNQAQCDTATVTITVNSNLAPVAAGLSIGGTPQPNIPLTGTYAYSDAESNAEATSTFRWVRQVNNTSPAGGLTVGTGASYTPSNADVGQYLFFCVTPRALAGTTPGLEVCTATSAIVVPSVQPATPIPTLSQWAMILMSASLALAAFAALKRNRR